MAPIQQEYGEARTRSTACKDGVVYEAKVLRLSRSPTIVDRRVGCAGLRRRVPGTFAADEGTRQWIAGSTVAVRYDMRWPVLVLQRDQAAGS
jgi:hypothetical protein